jgi:SAM-dependent methyltransferase
MRKASLRRNLRACKTSSFRGTNWGALQIQAPPESCVMNDTTSYARIQSPRLSAGNDYPKAGTDGFGEITQIRARIIFESGPNHRPGSAGLLTKLVARRRAKTAKNSSAEDNFVSRRNEVRTFKGANSAYVNGYELRAPAPQNALDIFTGEWSSLLPEPECAGLVAGGVPLFADGRVEALIETLGGAAGMKVLELGPLEGGHSWMLERAGVASVLAIEGNRRAFLRCLVMQNVLDMRRVRFVCGDFWPYLSETADTFDLVFASGVLYHQLEPLGLLADIARVAPALFLWTHYYDAERITMNPALAPRFGAPHRADYAGRSYERVAFQYLTAENPGFCGGSQAQSHWLPRAEILDALHSLGFSDVTILVEDPNHPNGPSFGLLARQPREIKS